MVFDAEADGDLDLILASATGSPVVLQNNSDNSFSELKLFAEVQNLKQFAAADFDEDGDSDAVLLDTAGVMRFSRTSAAAFIRKEVFLQMLAKFRIFQSRMRTATANSI